MPFIGCKVTKKLSSEKKEVLKSKLGEAIAIIPGKSEEWLMVGFEDEYPLFFRGKSLDGGAFIEIKIFGKAAPKSLNELTAEVCKIFKDELDIAGENIYVKYEEVSHWGWNGVNF